AVAHYLAVRADDMPVVGERVEGSGIGNGAVERDRAALAGRPVAARAGRRGDVVDRDDGRVRAYAAVLVRDREGHGVGAVVRRREPHSPHRAVAHYLAVGADDMPVVGERV